jgi:hypothetical protein
MGYIFDTSEWPIAQFRFIGRLNPTEREQYLSDADTLIARNEAYACVLDGRHMIMPDSELVRRQSQWIRDNRAAMARLNRGTAFITASAMIRGLVNAVLFFQPFPAPHAFFGTVPEGMSWARARLDGEALKPP